MLKCCKYSSLGQVTAWEGLCCQSPVLAGCGRGGILLPWNLDWGKFSKGELQDAREGPTGLAQ